jgi:hypothetical protein
MAINDLLNGAGNPHEIPHQIGLLKILLAACIASYTVFHLEMREARNAARMKADSLSQATGLNPHEIHNLYARRNLPLTSEEQEMLARWEEAGQEYDHEHNQ